MHLYVMNVYSPRCENSCCRNSAPKQKPAPKQTPHEEKEKEVTWYVVVVDHMLVNVLC